MDPISIALGLGTGIGGIAGAAYETTANNRLQKRNNVRIATLEDMEKRGAFGMTPVEQRALANDLQAPMQQAAAAGRARAEQLQAAAGGTSAAGADLAQLRTEQARQMGQAANQVAGQVRATDAAKAQAQKQELEGRLQSQAEMKQNDIETMLNAIAGGARAGGALAASPEKDLRSTLLNLSTKPGAPTPAFLQPGLGSVPTTPEAVMPAASVSQLRTAGYSDAEILGLAQYVRANPAKLQELINAKMMGGYGDALNALPSE